MGDSLHFPRPLHMLPAAYGLSSAGSNAAAVAQLAALPVQEASDSALQRAYVHGQAAGMNGQRHGGAMSTVQGRMATLLPAGMDGRAAAIAGRAVTPFAEYVEAAGTGRGAPTVVLAASNVPAVAPPVLGAPELTLQVPDSCTAATSSTCQPRVPAALLGMSMADWAAPALAAAADLVALPALGPATATGPSSSAAAAACADYAIGGHLVGDAGHLRKGKA